MNPLLRASPDQMLHFWEEMMQAEAGTNGYAGSTAEIYVSRFMVQSSIVVLDHVRFATTNEREHSQDAIDAYREAGQLIHALSRLFEERRHVVIAMDEGDLDDLLGPKPFTHRVHLSVKRKS